MAITHIKFIKSFLYKEVWQYFTITKIYSKQNTFADPVLEIYLCGYFLMPRGQRVGNTPIPQQRVESKEPFFLNPEGCDLSIQGMFWFLRLLKGSYISQARSAARE